MNLLKAAVETRMAQLKRQANTTPNPMIKQIVEQEQKDLENQYNAFELWITDQTKNKK